VPLVKPEYAIPDIPQDLTILSDDDLMEMFSHAVAWQNFTASAAIEAEIREADYEYVLEKAESEAVVSAWTGTSNDRVSVAKAHRALDPQVNAVKESWLKSKASRKRAQVVRDNCERIVNLISRELTRRVGRDSTERRTHRWTS